MASLAASSKLQVISTGDSALELRLAGEWVVGEPIPPIEDLLTQLASGPAPRRIAFDASRLGRWDSLLLTFLIKLIDYCAEHAVEANREGLPQGVQGLLALAYAVPERQGARRESQRVGWLTRIGNQALDASREVINLITFVGEANPTLIGGFVLGALVLLVGGVLLFGKGLFFAPKRQQFVIYFPDSVNGLNVGAPVKLKGVTVGTVTDVRVQYDVKNTRLLTPVIIDFEPERVTDIGGQKRPEVPPTQALIERGLRAQLPARGKNRPPVL